MSSWEEVESHVWLLKEDEGNYMKGWYFADETEGFHGPFSTIDEARSNLTRYAKELTDA
jgi:hypothetical protein